jgi:hypothetical protein
MFFYLSIKEIMYSKELDDTILEHYELSRQHYDRIKYLIKPKPVQEVYDLCPIP